MRESANYITDILAIEDNIIKMKEIYKRYNVNLLEDFNVNLLKAIQESFRIERITKTNSYLDDIILKHSQRPNDDALTYKIIYFIIYIIKNYNNIYSTLGSSPSNISENMTNIDDLILTNLLYESRKKKRGRSNSSTTDSTKNQSKRQRMSGYLSKKSTNSLKHTRKRSRSNSSIKDSTVIDLVKSDIKNKSKRKKIKVKSDINNKSKRQRINGDVYNSQ
jgi:hypothetical protein